MASGEAGSALAAVREEVRRTGDELGVRLRLLVGSSRTQTFATGDDTIFLLWQGKVPTVIDASKLVVGDRIVVRVRAEAGSSLSEVESSPARHVGDKEPASSK